MRITKESLIRGIIVCSVCGLFAVLSLALGSVYYDGVDDETMNLIAVGAYDPGHGQYLIYNSVIYGWLLKALFHIAPMVNWYFWVMIFLNFLALSACCTALTYKKDYIISILITVLVNIIFSVFFYRQLQFTQNAFFYTAVAVILIHVYLSAEGGIIPAIAGGIFAAFGIMIRPACALAVIPFAVVLFGIDLRKMKGDHGKLWKKSAALMITAGCVVMLYLGNYLALHIPAGWNYFERYNHVISGLLDYGMPDYETYRDEYEKIGMDETEYRMVSNYIVADPEYLPLEKLEQVLALKKRTERGMLFQPENFQKTCYTILSSAKDRYLPFLWIFLGGVVVFLHKREKLCWLLFSVVIFGEYWYMCARGRVMWRVECGIWTTAILCLAALIILERELNKRSRIGNLLVGAVAGCFALLQMGSLVYEFQNTKKGEISPEQLNVSSFFVSIEPERDVNFYMGGIITFDFHVTRSVYDIDKKYEGYYGNFAYLGGWPYSSPVNAHYSEMHGITNPVRSLLELDNCYLADNAGAEEILLDYYRTHYNADTQVEDLGIRNNIHIWRFYVPG